MSAGASSGVGPWTRVRVGSLVFLSLALFALAAGLATWLAERPNLRTRYDLTASGRNTLDPALADLVDKLPERVMIEVFFRPLPEPIDRPGYEAQGRTREFLRVLQNARPEKIKVIEHKPDDLAGATQALAELRIDGDEYGLLVVHRGDNRVPLRLFQDIAQLHLGDPRRDPPVMPSLAAYRGEEAIASALKRVSLTERAKVYFTTGHGERDSYASPAPDGNENRQIGALQSALVGDGFETERFEGQGHPIPDDCSVLAVIDPSQALAEEEVAAIRTYIEKGGRLLIGASLRYPDGPGSTRELAAAYGVDVGAGFVAESVAGPTGFVEGIVDCANVFVPPEGLSLQHPVTESLARYGSTLRSLLTRPLARKESKPGMVVTELARSSERSWIDLPNAEGKFDWKADDQKEVTHTRTPVAFAVEITPAGLLGPPAPEDRARVVVLGSSDALSSHCMVTNKDFALNAFNWLAAREYRLSIAPRSEERRILDVRGTDKLFQLRSLSVFLLPGLCAILGLLTWYLRRR